MKVSGVLKRSIGVAVAGLISMSLLIAGSSVAVATPNIRTVELPPTSLQATVQEISSKTVTSDDLKSLNDALSDTNLPRTEASVGSKTTYTYTVANGSMISLVKNVELNLSGTAGGRAMTVPAFRVAVENWSGYVYLNGTDQNALIQGGATSLGVVICASLAATGPAGWAGCAAVSGLLVAAATYLSANGICSNEMRLTIWGGGGSAVQCV